MKDESINVFNEIFTTKNEYSGTIVENHINKLRELDQHLPTMESYFLVTNTSTQKYEFVSKNAAITLGVDIDEMKTGGIPFVFSLFHPEDLPIWLKALEDLMIFTMMNVPFEDRHKLSYNWNFRIRNKQGEYLNIMEHQTPTSFDETGKPIIGVSHATVVGKNQAKPIIGILKQLNDNNEYETIYYKNYSETSITDALSFRELDILRLLAINKTSKEIAENLCISPHTVDGHRRNILKKLNYSSTQELMQYCHSREVF